jgi:hypothetical protein
MWIRELRGAEAWSAISEYMTSPDLRATARRRAEDAVAGPPSQGRGRAQSF